MPRHWDRPLIGQPLANVDYYLLDENQKTQRLKERRENSI